MSRVRPVTASELAERIRTKELELNLLLRAAALCGLRCRLDITERSNAATPVHEEVIVNMGGERDRG